MERQYVAQFEITQADLDELQDGEGLFVGIVRYYDDRARATLEMFIANTDNIYCDDTVGGKMWRRRNRRCEHKLCELQGFDGPNNCLWQVTEPGTYVVIPQLDYVDKREAQYVLGQINDIGCYNEKLLVYNHDGSVQKMLVPFRKPVTTRTVTFTREVPADTTVTLNIGGETIKL